MARWGEGVRCGKPRPARRVGGSLMVMTRHTRRVVTVPARRFESPRESGRLFTCFQFANSVHMAPPRSWELIALSLLAGLGFGLALDRGDLIFVAVFGAACGMAIVGGMQRFP
jgi:hypothetical protein